MENFIKSSIDLFNTVPVDDEKIDTKIVNSKELIEHGYFFIDEDIFISDRVKNILIEKSFQINNIFVTLYNSLEDTLYPPTRFVNIKINGVQYTDIIDFSNALTELINAQNE
jgi:hypothetical protein